MKITFVLPFTHFTGGNRIIVEHVVQLNKLGHSACIVYPRPELIASGNNPAALKLTLWNTLEYIKRKLHKDEIAQYAVEKVLIEVPELKDEYFPDADAVIATAWNTAAPVTKLSNSKGKKFYYIQHYEAWSSAIEEEVNATWKLPLTKIVVSTWLKDLAQQKFGEIAFGPVTNGINTSIFYNSYKTLDQPPVIGMQYHKLNWKGIGDGLEAVTQAKEQFPGLGLTLFGMYRRAADVPDYANYHFRPSNKLLRELYSGFNIFLSSSWTEGCQLPPMEAMACGTAVVATEVGGIPDYSIPEETVLTAPPKRPDLLAKQLIRLLSDKELLQKISVNGHNYIQQYTWERSSRKLLDILQSQSLEKSE